MVYVVSEEVVRSGGMWDDGTLGVWVIIDDTVAVVCAACEIEGWWRRMVEKDAPNPSQRRQWEASFGGGCGPWE